MKLLFKEKKVAKSLQLIENVEKAVEGQALNQFTLKILKAYCYFQLKQYFDFRELWASMDHNLNSKLTNKELEKLYEKLNELWKDYLGQINSVADAQLQIDQLKEREDF